MRLFSVNTGQNLFPLLFQEIIASPPPNHGYWAKMR